MAENITKYTEKFKIRASEVDVNGKANLPSLCTLFQEVAGNHALKLNFDISQLQEQNLTWVLHRMDIKMERFPDWRETITIETWPAAGDALRAYRNYRILDEKQQQIGCCLSYWMMMNMTTRRPTRMPSEVLNLRLKEIDHVMPVKSDRLSPENTYDQELEIRVRKSDLDMNRHVNNARYVEWMLEHYDTVEASNIQRIDIMFMKESTKGDKLTSSIKFNDSRKTKHQLKNQNGDVLALAVCQ